MARTSSARSTATSTTTSTSRRSEQLQVPAEITTDAKVIPTLVARQIEGGTDPTEAFRAVVSELAGSMGIGVQAADAPDRLMLSLRGSGQALYIGLAEDAFVVASEPYGVVEETPRYLRMDGETPANTDRADGDARSGGRARRRARGHARGCAADGLRRHAAAGASHRVADRRDHHARHRPRRLPALPAEGDLRGAGVVPQDPARQDHRHGPMRSWACCSATTRCPRRCASNWRQARSSGSWWWGRAPPRSRVRASPKCSAAWPGPACVPTPSPPPSSPASRSSTT